MIKPEDLLGTQVGRERNPTPPAQGTRRRRLWEKGRESITWELGFFLLSALSSNTFPPKTNPKQPKSTAPSPPPPANHLPDPSELGNSRAGCCPERTPPPPSLPKLIPCQLISNLPLSSSHSDSSARNRGQRNMCFNSFPDHIYKCICKRNPKERILFLSFFYLSSDRKGREGGGEGRFGRFDAGTIRCCWKEERMRELLSRLSLFVRAKSVNIHFAAEERK
jgi:hypothetical protein